MVAAQDSRANEATTANMESQNTGSLAVFGVFGLMPTLTLNCV
jgi:hypothetical protein